MKIRQETEKDHLVVYDLIKAAFETAKVRDGDEQDYAANLRKGEGYIPELELVAELDGVLIGHIMLTKTYIIDGGNRYLTLLLAPLSVLLDFRSKGVGAALVHEALKLAREMGYTSVCLAGDPAYYGRFGFQPSISFGITHSYPPQNNENIMLYELTPHALDGVSGKLVF